MGMGLCTRSPIQAKSLHVAARMVSATAFFPYGRWRYWFDAQLRYFDIGSGINQYQLRPGIGYTISDNMVAHAGYLHL
jgi:hypothetical protein